MRSLTPHSMNGYLVYRRTVRIAHFLDHMYRRADHRIFAVRWDPNKEDITFFNQSASLYTTYYMTQISVHRQFIPTSRRAQPALALPSLTICANAARSCVNVVHMQYQRTGVITCALKPMQLSLFTACIVLLVNLWGGSQSEKEEQSLREGIQKCLGILKDTESRSVLVG